MLLMNSGTIPINDGIVGMAGEFIAAVLETAGLYGQSQVLKHFAQFFGVIGAVTYVWVIIGALKSVAMFGNYKQALYLLIGPVLFWWMLTNTVEVTQTAHQVGNRPASKNEQPILTTLKESGNPAVYARPATVSWFFAKYDQLVSSVIQQIVSSLVDTKHMDDVLASARERVLHRVSRVRATDKDFLQLITVSLMGDCARQVSLSKNLGDPRLANAKQGTPDFEERGIMLTQYQALKARPIAFDDTLKTYLHALGIQTSEPTTCEKVWDYTRQAAEKAAAKVLQPTPEEKAQYPADLDWKQVSTAINDKLSDPALSASEKNVKSVEVLAAFYLRNSVASTIQGQLGRQLAGKEAYDGRVNNEIFGVNANLELSGLRLALVHFAGSIPYFQGIFLYLLTCAFPFFCVFLLMPSRYMVFVAWMSCWLWVKSWDVGFAAIVVMRKLFWDMMPHAGQLRNAGNFNEVSWKDPGSIFNVIYQNDPTSNLNSYILIISILTTAVPVFTAHLALGAMNLLSLFRAGVDQPGAAIANHKVRGQRGIAMERNNAKLSNNLLGASVKAAVAAGKNPGFTADGMSRYLPGDGALGRYMNERAALALANERFSEASQDLDASYVSRSRRAMLYNFGGPSQSYINAGLNQQNEALQSGPAYANISAFWPLFALAGIDISKPRNPETDISQVGGWGALNNVLK